MATGRVAAMVDPIVAPWDIGPMPVLLAEAGGRFTDLSGVETIESGSGVGSNGLVHHELLALLGQLTPWRYPGGATSSRSTAVSASSRSPRARATRDRMVPTGTSHTSAASA